MTDSTPPPAADSKWKALALVFLVLLGIAGAVLIALHVKESGKAAVTVVYTEGEAGAPDVNTGDVVDATDPQAVLEPRLGYRYKLFIEDDSDDLTSGIAKIGGRTTFVSGARRGQTVLADVTRVRERVVDANLVRVLSSVDLPPRPPREPFQPSADDSAGHVVEGAEMDVIISEESSKNPGFEGIARVEGLVVVVNGVPEVGRRVNVRITGRQERIAFAEPTGKPAGTDPLPTSVRPVRRIFQPRPGDPAAHVVPGAEMDVVISEESGQNPGVDGVARVNGLVVFVQGVPTLGETVHVRITERRDRAANAVPSGKPAGSGSTPPAGDVIRRAFTPDTAKAALDHVVAGAELDLEILERSEKFPDREGVAKIDGLVVFVTGATNVGETVRARITARRETVAFAEVLAAP